MKNNASILYAFCLAVGDFLALLTAFVIAYILRVSLDPRPLINDVSSISYLKIWFVLTPLWIIIFALLGLYSRRIYNYRWREIVALFIGSTLGIMVVITYDFAAQTAIFPARLIPVYALIIGFLLLVLERTLLRSGRMRLWRYGIGINNVLIIGKGSAVDSLLKNMSPSSHTGYKIIAIASDNIPPKFKGKSFSSTDAALEGLSKLKLHTIVYTGVAGDTLAVDKVLAAAQANHLAFKFVPAHDGILSNNIEVELFQGLPVVSVHQTALIGWGRIVKRLFDILSSLLAIIILSPVFIAIYVAELFTGGKAVFKQKRLSRFETNFYIYKFRTLKKAYNGLSPEEAFAKMGKPGLAITYRANGDYLPNDPRISKLGKFLRRTSLDETLQLFNILKGDISLVGPRALVPQELKNYAFKNLILSVKSGLTGLAQISGRRDISFEERRALDLYYVQNWTFWMDIKIIFRTIINVIGGRGAQ